MKKRWIKFIPIVIVVLIGVMTIAPAQIFPCISTDLSVTVGECGETSIAAKAFGFDGDPYYLEVSKFDGTSYIPFQNWSGIIDSPSWKKTFTTTLRGGDYRAYFYVNSTCHETVFFSVERCYREVEYTPAGFIKLLYEDILWRSFTADEKQTWLERYAMGWTAADMVKDFIFGEEIKERLSGYTDGEFLTFIFNALFSRDPDMESYEALLERMENGLTREEVLDEFMMSDEFAGLCNRFKTIPYSGYCGTCEE